MKKFIAIICIVVCFLTGCKKDSPELHSGVNTDIILKVSVLLSDEVLVDGEKISILQLNERLADIKKQNGIVWYYREIGTQEPPPAATEVIKLVIKHQLPISMSSMPDFSNIVEMDGTSRPRE